ALAMLNVKGEENKKVYSGELMEGIYQPEGGAIQEMPGEAPTAKVATTLAERIEMGKQVYSQTCVACHQMNGEGLPNAFPPLAKSDYLNEDVNRAIDIVLNGMSGEITVNGNKYNSVMTAQNITDEEIANVLTYIYNNWDNNKTEVTPEMVKAVRNK